jgi:multidrug efflux pump subunit AcrB
MRIRGPGGTEVPFATVASVEVGRGFSTIQRADRQRVISVTADVDLDRANPNEVIDSILANDLPPILADHPGITYSLEGERREQAESLASLGRGYIVALFAIFALLAIPLRSYVQPLIVMSAIPFGFVGAVWGHIVLGINLTILSAAGFVALSGVVVNDSLIMVDFVNRGRREGLSLIDAARQAGAARFRAIILTSLSTYAGVTPLLLERSLQAQFLKPLAVSLGYGVVFSTLVILVLVPSIYLILADVQTVVRRWLGLEEAPRQTPGAEGASSRH